MKNIPDYVPQLITEIYFSGLVSDFKIPTPIETPEELEAQGLKLDIKNWREGLSQKECLEKLMHDKRMEKVWSPLSRHFKKYTPQTPLFLEFFNELSEASKGPSDWDSLTQKEKELKVSKISKLAKELYFEMANTPLDKNVTHYMRYYGYFDRFISELDEEKKLLAKNELSNFFELKGHFYQDSEQHEVSSFWTRYGVPPVEMSSALQDLFRESANYKPFSIIKRKNDVMSVYMVRKVSAFFLKYFDSPLYNITAAISSVMLNEEITLEEVRSRIQQSPVDNR